MYFFHKFGFGNGYDHIKDMMINTPLLGDLGDNCMFFLVPSLGGQDPTLWRRNKWQLPVKMGIRGLLLIKISMTHGNPKWHFSIFSIDYRGSREIGQSSKKLVWKETHSKAKWPLLEPLLTWGSSQFRSLIRVFKWRESFVTILFGSLKNWRKGWRFKVIWIELEALYLHNKIVGG